MNALIAAAIANSRAVLTSLVLILILGGVTYFGIAKEQDPDIPIPFYVISLSHEGISPEDAERLLIKPMEIELRDLDGLKELKSIARQGSARVYLEYNAGFDPDQAVMDIREKVERAKAELPSETDEPRILEFNTASFPIVTLVLYGDAPERSLNRIARQLRDRVESLPAVLSADIQGQREEVLEVIIDPARLSSYGLSQADILNTIDRNNRLVAAGALDTGSGRFSVKLPGLFESARDVLDLPIKVSGDGVVAVKDVAEVRRTFKDSASFARYNGKSAITIDISKRVGENVIDLGRSVRAVVAEAEKHIPEGVRLEIMTDQSTNMVEFLSMLESAVINAIALVAVTVVAALGLRSAALVGISIPGSFLLGILLLGAFGYTVNQVVMFGLILAVGLLVDGAIVVTEYADRKMREGLSARLSYGLAAQRMAWPIIASTATTLAAFMPLLFWPGIVGEYMRYLPLTLIFVLSASLLMALIFMPTLGATIARNSTVAADAAATALAGEGGLDIDRLGPHVRRYVHILESVLRHPGRTALGIAAMVVAIFIAFTQLSTGREFFPQGEPTLVQLDIHARGNLSAIEQDRLVHEVERAIDGVAGIRSVYALSGNVGGGFDAAEDSVGRIIINLADWRERRPGEEIIAEIRRRADRIPGIHVEPSADQSGPSQGKDIQIQVLAEDRARLSDASQRLRQHMEGSGTLLDIADSGTSPGIEWQLSVDRAQAARFGTDIVNVGAVVQLVTNGVKVGEYRPDDSDDEVDIRIRFPMESRGISALDALKVNTPQGEVPLSNFVTRTAEPNVGAIRRVDSIKMVAVNANVAPGILVDDQVQALKSWIAAQDFGPDVRMHFRGADEMQNESQAFLFKAFFIALGVMGLILIAQFNSFHHSLLILLAVLFSVAGVLLGLIVTARPFGIVMTGVGVISLAGIVVNNNIILIDTFARHVQSGIEPLRAILLTGAQRLRPVMLTTITTIIGLLPMALQVNVDFIHRDVSVGDPSSVIWVDLAIAMAFGLGFSTILTLVMTPAMLALQAKRKERRAIRREIPLPQAAE